jgi:hypothetical protein
MPSKTSSHVCHFELEENGKGYLTGNFVCLGCGRKFFHSQQFTGTDTVIESASQKSATNFPELSS